MNFNLEFADPIVWNDEVDYAINDVVFHDGEAYTAIDYVPIGTPLTDSTKWRRSGKYVRTADIADGSITTAKLENGAVTLSKLDSSVTDLIDDFPNVENGLQLSNDTLSAKLGSGMTFDGNGAISLSDGDIAGAVDDWLDDHPEATTTVQDGSITDAKLAQTGGILDTVDSLIDSLANDTSYTENLSLEFFQGVVHNGAYNNPNTAQTFTTYSNLLLKETPFKVHVNVASGYKALLVFYSSESDSTPITSTWLTGNTVFEDTNETSAKTYFCFEVRNDQTTTITPEEALAAIDAYYVFDLLPDRKRFINIVSDSTARINVTESCVINGNGHTINVGTNEQYGMYIYSTDSIVVDVYDLIIKGGTESAVRVNRGATVNFYNCVFDDSSGSGLAVTNGNTNCFDCSASNNTLDGFNYHFTGKNTVYNCYAIDNGDDGISNHEQSSLKIVGGRFIGNGKAGIACPTYGAQNTDILDVYCADNSRFGILMHSDVEVSEIVIVQNAIISNSQSGATVRGYQSIFNNVKFVNCLQNTETANGGTITIL